MFDELVDQAIEDATVDPDGLHLFRVKFNDAGECTDSRKSTKHPDRHQFQKGHQK